MHFFPVCIYLYSHLYSCYRSMTNKEALQKILTKLQPYWPMAEKILLLLGTWDLTDEQITWVLSIIDESMKDVLDEWLRKKLWDVRAFLQHLYEEEAVDRKKEEWELDALLKRLDTV